jgi:hypothetical protein
LGEFRRDGRECQHGIAGRRVSGRRRRGAGWRGTCRWGWVGRSS